MAAFGWMLIGAAVALALEAVVRSVLKGIDDMATRRYKGGGRG